MSTINYGSKDHEVHPLSEAERTWYWMEVDRMAKLAFNPWQDLYEKVKHLPANLQEIVFVNSRKSLFPLTTKEQTAICCCQPAVRLLFGLATDVDFPDMEFLGELAAIELYAELIVALGESYTGVKREPERITGHANIMAHLAQKLKEQAAKKTEGKTDGVS